MSALCNCTSALATNNFCELTQNFSLQARWWRTLRVFFLQNFPSRKHVTDAFCVAVRCVRNKAQQFAKRLQECMKGLGTDDNTLVRVCVSRSEIDMVQIKEHFKTMFDQDLGKYIAVSSSDCFFVRSFVRSFFLSFLSLHFLLSFFLAGCLSLPVFLSFFSPLLNSPYS